MAARTSPPAQAAVLGGAGVLVLVAVWWVAALSFLQKYLVPTPGAVLRATVDAGWGFYRPTFGPTLHEATLGFLWGVAAALLLSAVVLIIPIAEPLVMQLAVVTYCVPIVAIAPVFIVINNAPQPGQVLRTAVELAALSVFFTTVVGTVLGLRSADPASLDVVHVYGGGRVQQLVRVRLVSALPHVVSALQIAAPAAWLGALLGEFFDGRLEGGVAHALVQAQQSQDVALAWSIGLACAVVSGVFYLLFGLLGRLVTPWSKGRTA